MLLYNNNNYIVTLKYKFEMDDSYKMSACVEWHNNSNNNAFPGNINIQIVFVKYCNADVSSQLLPGCQFSQNM